MGSFLKQLFSLLHLWKCQRGKRDFIIHTVVNGTYPSWLVQVVRGLMRAVRDGVQKIWNELDAKISVYILKESIPRCYYRQSCARHSFWWTCLLMLVSRVFREINQVLIGLLRDLEHLFRSTSVSRQLQLDQSARTSGLWLILETL